MTAHHARSPHPSAPPLKDSTRDTTFTTFSTWVGVAARAARRFARKRRKARCTAWTACCSLPGRCGSSEMLCGERLAMDGEVNGEAIVGGAHVTCRRAAARVDEASIAATEPSG